VIRALLDTAILLPPTLRDTLLRCVEARLFSPFWSEFITAELVKSLVEHEQATPGGASRLIDHMNRAFPSALVSGFDHILAGLTNDPKDRDVLGAVVAATAATIVT